MPCKFINGYRGIQCADIIKLRQSQIAGTTDEDLANQLEELCTFSDSPTCLLAESYLNRLDLQPAGQA